MGTQRTPSGRILSLDQFRGYTVLGMFFVNFVGHFDQIGAIWKHHNTYCSYADTIMPQFFFAVGFAYRLTLLKRLGSDGPWKAYAHVLRRNLGLILVGLVIYHLDGEYKTWARLQQQLELGWWEFLKSAFARDPFQTLVHIAVTSIWVMPVIAAGPLARLAFTLASAGLHLYLSHLFYYDWVWTRPGIDGGPLGFMTWTIPLLAGSFAYDFLAAGPTSTAIVKSVAWGAVLMIAGYAFSCLNTVTPPNRPEGTGLSAYLVEPPFVAPPKGFEQRQVDSEESSVPRRMNIWTMSQRAGSISYLTFSAGLSLALYGLFVLMCDVGGLRLGILRTLGSNALAAYIIHGMVEALVKPYSPRDGPLWFAYASFGIFFVITYLILRYMEKNKLYLRL
jgi:predicted acyltransferase